MKVENDSYVSIKHFINSEKRTLDYLSSLYEDLDLLSLSIQELLSKKIDFDNKTVLIKPNWVLHPKKEHEYFSLYTHPNIILSLVQFILKNFHPIKITIGDAPLQDCDWERLISKNFLTEIEILSKRYQIPIEVFDFRRVKFNVLKNDLIEECNPIENYLIFDLKDKSKLEAITKDEGNKFRVTNYNPKRTDDAHQKRMHKYCVTKELFNNDIIITIPKLKTHQKAGITGALKILVGINGDKDFLPHHRKGGSINGGDCYPGSNIFRKISEDVLDYSNQFRGKWNFKILRKVVGAFWRLSGKSDYHNLAAAWYGNDTVWRMVYDLNIIALYGTKKGELANNQQRAIYVLGDGIVGGQGNGPLHPDPLPLGVLTFSNNSLLHDFVQANLMEFDYKKIPILKDFKSNEFLESTFILNNEKVNFEELNKLSIKTEPSPGWKGFIEI